MFPGLYLAYRDATSSLLLLLLPWSPQPPALPLPARETPFSFKVPRGLRQAGEQPASPTEGASSAADVLRDVIWHILLRPALLREGWGYRPAVFGGGGPRSGEGPPRVWSRSHQAFWWLPLGCLFPGGVDVIWHIYSGLQCSEGEGGIHLPSSRHTSPHPCPPAKKFWRRSEHFFFSRGLFPGGLVASLPQVCELEPGEALSPAPLAAGTCRLQFRGGEHVPVTSPRGRTPASSLIFRGEVGLGATQQPLPRAREGGESTEGPVMMHH